MNQLSKDTKRTFFLKEIKPESLEILNLMGGGDISKLSYDEVRELCRRYSRGNYKFGGETRDTSSKLVKSITEA